MAHRLICAVFRYLDCSSRSPIDSMSTDLLLGNPYIPNFYVCPDCPVC